jgi:hypothetical protein
MCYPAFVDSSQGKEFWALLLEKAFAKLHGSYAAIEGGWMCEGFMDLSGGLGETHAIADVKADWDNGTFFDKLKGWLDNGYLLGCGSTSGSDTHKSAANIVLGHAYSILRVAEHGSIKLMQLRNPWGSTDYTGKYSDTDKESWVSFLTLLLTSVVLCKHYYWNAFVNIG